MGKRENGRVVSSPKANARLPFPISPFPHFSHRPHLPLFSHHLRLPHFPHLAFFSHLLRAPLIAIIWLYQHTLGVVLPNACRFTPTCSQYCIEAVRRHGALKGTWLGIRRLLRCNPYCKSGYDPVP